MKRRLFLQLFVALAGVPLLPKTAAKPCCSDVLATSPEAYAGIVAYLEAFYRHIPEIAVILDKLSGASTISVEDLRTIDRLITLYEEDPLVL